MLNLFENVLLLGCLGVISYVLVSVVIHLITIHQDRKMRENLKIRHIRNQQRVQEKREMFDLYRESLGYSIEDVYKEEENDCLSRLSTYLLSEIDKDNSDKVEEELTDDFWDKCTSFSRHIHHGTTSPEEADDEYFEELAKQKASMFYNYQEKPLPNLAERLKDYTVEDIMNAFAL